MKLLVAVRTNNVDYAKKCCTILNPMASVCTIDDWLIDDYSIDEAKAHRRLDVKAYMKNLTECIFIILNESESSDIYKELASELAYTYMNICINYEE